MQEMGAFNYYEICSVLGVGLIGIGLLGAWGVDKIKKYKYKKDTSPGALLMKSSIAGTNELREKHRNASAERTAKANREYQSEQDSKIGL